MKRLSIIIPIFNVEDYLEKCIRSLEDQDIPHSDYEIICVNDGSPDSSREVVKRLKEEYENIVLIDQENQGVSRARNNGIDIAAGEYILFIDPDDYVDSYSFARILKNAVEADAEVSFLGFTILNENGSAQEKVYYENLTKQVFQGIDAYYLARGDGNTDPDRMWAVQFRTEFLNKNNFRYLPGVPYLEDGELIARILSIAERCIFDGNSFYQRTKRPGSATHSDLFFSEKATNGFLKAAGNLKKYQQEGNLEERQKEFLNQPIVKFVLLSINSSLRWNSRKKFTNTLRSLKKLNLRQVNLTGCKREYRNYGLAYNISPFLSAMALIIYAGIKKINITEIFRGKYLWK